MAERKKKPIPAKKTFIREQLVRITELLDWWLPRCIDEDSPVASGKAAVEIVLKLMDYKAGLLAALEDADAAKKDPISNLMEELAGDSA